MPLDLTTITVDTGPAFLLAGIILVGLMSVWGIRKVIKMMNRS